MNETRSPRNELVDELLSQDASLSASHLEELRMNLENSLKDLERRAHSVRRWSLIASAGVVLCYLSILPLEMFQLTKVPGIAPMWSILTTIVFFTAAVLLSLYWYKYRPALERGRVDLQTAMIAQLQHQLSEVIQRLDKQTQ